MDRNADGARDEILNECDLVMKGGVTSGIVYPGAVAAIAERYRLRAIGGTSAGAIGAAAAAAMEFGRTSGKRPDARARLAGVSDQLGAATANGLPLLARLFEPDAPTERPYRLLMEAVRRKRMPALSRHVRPVMMRPLIGSALTMIAAVSILGLLQWPLGIIDWIELALIAIFGTAVMTVAFAWTMRVWRPLLAELLGWVEAVADNGFGFCSGLARPAETDGSSLPSLTEWLHMIVQDLAGLPEDSPLTFADLWTAGFRTARNGREAAIRAALSAAPKNDAGRRPDSVEETPRAIDLALVATDLNRGLSIQLPFLRRDDRLYVRKSDLRALFPESIVAWMIARQGATDLTGVALGDVPGDDLIRLPRAGDLPVLFAVRVSMSFPLLFRAMRLYLVRHRAKAVGGGEELVELWWADGGITSNFPIHLFDAPIPARPTFLLNLIYHDEELEPDERRPTDTPTAAEEPVEGAGFAADLDGPIEEMVYMPRSNHGRLVSLVRFQPGNPAKRLLRFGMRVVSTARTWGDNQLMDVAGYRDRIVHIKMRPDEGGFNFAMSPEKIADLVKRGTRAGEVISIRFLPQQKTDPLNAGEPLFLTWANHRMVRLRAFLAAMEVTASRFTVNWKRDKAQADPAKLPPGQLQDSLEQLILKLGTAGASGLRQRAGFPFRNRAQRTLALDFISELEELRALSARTPGIELDFLNGKPTSPRPKPMQRIRPANDSDPLAER